MGCLCWRRCAGGEESDAFESACTSIHTTPEKPVLPPLEVLSPEEPATSLREGNTKTPGSGESRPSARSRPSTGASTPPVQRWLANQEEAGAWSDDGASVDGIKLDPPGAMSDQVRGVGGGRGSTCAAQTVVRLVFGVHLFLKKISYGFKTLWPYSRPMRAPVVLANPLAPSLSACFDC